MDVYLFALSPDLKTVNIMCAHVYLLIGSCLYISTCIQLEYYTDSKVWNSVLMCTRGVGSIKRVAGPTLQDHM